MSRPIGASCSTRVSSSFSCWVTMASSEARFDRAHKRKDPNGPFERVERSCRVRGLAVSIRGAVDLRALRVVIAIAEQGSVTRAAASLHQSSSAISHTLLDLETEPGLDLFHRLPRGMALTDAGEVFVAAA